MNKNSLGFVTRVSKRIPQKARPSEKTQVRKFNKETLDTIKKADRGEDLFGPFKNFDEMMKFINA